MPDKLATDVEILKREVADMKLIHGRLDNAITKITDVSNSINRMLAVHEEKLASQEDAISRQEINKIKKDLKDRVGVLERWRWLLIGGCIVIGFIIHKMMNFNITIA